MTEIEYVLNNFDKHFSPHRGKRIVLHGSRGYAEAIIDRFQDEYSFAGVMSMDPLEGGKWHGLPVLKEEDLRNGAVDMVILTERVKYEEAAFRAIRRQCKKNRIDIYNMYGLDEVSVHFRADTSGLLDPEKTLRCCEAYDIVAFEVMDTLFPTPEGLTMMVPRSMFADLIRNLRSQGKGLRFSLRKSFPEEEQIRGLRDSGLLASDGELIRREGEDLSFRSLAESAPEKKILYIGSGLVNEFILPQCYGIDCIFFVEQNALAFDCLLPNIDQPERTAFTPGQKESIEKQIRSHRLISFDIFDTLLLRKTLYPRDVYSLTEREAAAAGYEVPGFAAARARTEDSVPCCTLDQVYSGLAELYGWDLRTREAVMAIELKIERDVLTPRRPLADLFEYALGQGKRVVLTSDMYLPEPVLRSILEEKGIRGFERIFVSCDCKQAKQNGLFSKLLELCPQPGEVLHIGDNPAVDGSAAEAAGIDSIVVPSSLALAVRAGWGKAVEAARTLAERSLLGLAFAKLFADPFQNPNVWELSVPERMKHMGDSIIGPLMVGHTCFLISKLREEDFEAVLFLARDGWLPIKLYDSIRERLSLPRSVYYYANRRSAFLCCADSELDADRTYEISRAYGLSTSELLERVFMIPGDALLPRSSEELNTDYIRKHGSMIHEKAEGARRGYLLYSEKQGMLPGRAYAVVDFVAGGTIQQYLSQVLPYRFRGLYYGTHSPKKVAKAPIEYYLKGNNPALLRGFVSLENIFSAPEPSLHCMDESGTPVFQAELRGESLLSEIQAAWDEALPFAQEFFELFYRDGDAIDPALIEEMFAADSYLGIDIPAYDDWFQTELKKRNP